MEGHIYSAVMNSGDIPFVYLLLLYTQTCSSLHSIALFKLSMSGKSPNEIKIWKEINIRSQYDTVGS